MTTPEYTLETDTRAMLGLIVLQTDETIEDDFRELFAPDHVRLHVSRIPSGAEVTTESLRAMERALPAAAALLPETVNFDAIGYGCTSGTSQIGAEKVQALVQSTSRAKAVTNPLSAAFAALQHLGASRIGIVSPYSPDIVGTMRRDFEAAGFKVQTAQSFGEKVEANVAQITTASTVNAAEELTRNADIDAIFLSCTNLRTLRAIPEIEQKTGVPAVSSNLALAWHMAKLGGIAPDGFKSRLLAT